MVWEFRSERPAGSLLENSRQFQKIRSIIDAQHVYNDVQVMMFAVDFLASPLAAGVPGNSNLLATRHMANHNSGPRLKKA